MPPRLTGTVVKLIAGVVPPLDTIGEVPVTLVTPAAPPEDAIVMAPAPLVMVMLAPAVSVAFAKVLPVVFPISN